MKHGKNFTKPSVIVCIVLIIVSLISLITGACLLGIPATESGYSFIPIGTMLIIIGAITVLCIGCTLAVILTEEDW